MSFRLFTANRCLSADNRRSDGLLITTGWDLCPKHQPETGCDFGDGHRRPTVLERRCVLRKDQTGKTDDCHHDRGKHAERRQDLGDISRFEKQVKKEDGADTEKYRADVVRGADEEKGSEQAPIGDAYLHELPQNEKRAL